MACQKIPHIKGGHNGGKEEQKEPETYKNIQARYDGSHLKA
jgi:hypothetical protein